MHMAAFYLPSEFRLEQETKRRLGRPDKRREPTLPPKFETVLVIMAMPRPKSFGVSFIQARAFYGLTKIQSIVTNVCHFPQGTYSSCRS